MIFYLIAIYMTLKKHGFIVEHTILKPMLQRANIVTSTKFKTFRITFQINVQIPSQAPLCNLFVCLECLKIDSQIDADHQ